LSLSLTRVDSAVGGLLILSQQYPNQRSARVPPVQVPPVFLSIIAFSQMTCGGRSAKTGCEVSNERTKITLLRPRYTENLSSSHSYLSLPSGQLDRPAPSCISFVGGRSCKSMNLGSLEANGHLPAVVVPSANSDLFMLLAGWDQDPLGVVMV
jgi:hypothetical protein